MALYDLDRILCIALQTIFVRTPLSCNKEPPPHLPAFCAFFCCSFSLFSIFMNSRMPTGTPSNKSFPSSDSAASFEALISVRTQMISPWPRNCLTSEIVRSRKPEVRFSTGSFPSGDRKSCCRPVKSNPFLTGRLGACCESIARNEAAMLKRLSSDYCLLLGFRACGHT